MVLKASNINMKELLLNYSEMAAGNVIMQAATFQQEIPKQLQDILLSYTDAIQDTRSVSEDGKGWNISFHGCSGGVQFLLSESSFISILPSILKSRRLFLVWRGTSLKTESTIMNLIFFFLFPFLLFLPHIVINKCSSKVLMGFSLFATGA